MQNLSLSDDCCGVGLLHVQGVLDQDKVELITVVPLCYFSIYPHGQMGPWDPILKIPNSNAYSSTCPTSCQLKYILNTYSFYQGRSIND